MHISPPQSVGSSQSSEQMQGLPPGQQKQSPFPVPQESSSVQVMTFELLPAVPGPVPPLPAVPALVPPLPAVPAPVPPLPPVPVAAPAVPPPPDMGRPPDVAAPLAPVAVPPALVPAVLLGGGDGSGLSKVSVAQPEKAAKSILK
jgi:hypothetical protein